MVQICTLYQIEPLKGHFWTFKDQYCTFKGTFKNNVPIGTKMFFSRTSISESVDELPLPF